MNSLPSFAAAFARHARERLGIDARAETASTPQKRQHAERPAHGERATGDGARRPHAVSGARD